MDGYWPAPPKQGRPPGFPIPPFPIPPFPIHHSPSAIPHTIPIPSRKKSPAHRSRARCSPMSHAFVLSRRWYDVSRHCTWFTGQDVASSIKYSCITISIRPHQSLASHRPRCVHTARFRNQPWEEPLPGPVPYIHTWSNVLCFSLSLFSSSSTNVVFNFIFNCPRVRFILCCVLCSR